MELDYQAFMMIGFVLIQSLTAAKYIVGLQTRIAVLEHSHDTLDTTLTEIRKDVKELLRAVSS
jgi:hypothetical protein